MTPEEVGHFGLGDVQVISTDAQILELAQDDIEQVRHAAVNGLQWCMSAKVL